MSDMREVGLGETIPCHFNDFLKTVVNNIRLNTPS